MLEGDSVRLSSPGRMSDSVDLPTEVLSLPNEVLMMIIRYLIPDTHPVHHLDILVFRPYLPYYPHSRPSTTLFNLSRTCRRLDALVQGPLAREQREENRALCTASQAVLNLAQTDGPDRLSALECLTTLQNVEQCVQTIEIAAGASGGSTIRSAMG